MLVLFFGRPYVRSLARKFPRLVQFKSFQSITTTAPSPTGAVGSDSHPKTFSSKESYSSWRMEATFGVRAPGLSPALCAATKPMASR